MWVSTPEANYLEQLYRFFLNNENVLRQLPFYWNKGRMIVQITTLRKIWVPKKDDGYTCSGLIDRMKSIAEKRSAFDSQQKEINKEYEDEIDAITREPHNYIQEVSILASQNE